MIQTYPQTAPVHQLQRAYRSLINKAKRYKAPLYLLKNNKPESVLLDFNYWQTFIKQLEEADLESSIKIAEQELEQGKVKKLFSLKDLIK